MFNRPTASSPAGPAPSRRDRGRGGRATDLGLARPRRPRLHNRHQGGRRRRLCRDPWAGLSLRPRTGGAGSPLACGTNSSSRSPPSRACPSSPRRGVAGSSSAGTPATRGIAWPLPTPACRPWRTPGSLRRFTLRAERVSSGSPRMRARVGSALSSTGLSYVAAMIFDPHDNALVLLGFGTVSGGDTFDAARTEASFATVSITGYPNAQWTAISAARRRFPQLLRGRAPRLICRTADGGRPGRALQQHQCVAHRRASVGFRECNARRPRGIGYRSDRQSRRRTGLVASRTTTRHSKPCARFRRRIRRRLRRHHHRHLSQRRPRSHLELAEPRPSLLLDADLAIDPATRKLLAINSSSQPASAFSSRVTEAGAGLCSKTRARRPVYPRSSSMGQFVDPLRHRQRSLFPLRGRREILVHRPLQQLPESPGERPEIAGNDLVRRQPGPLAQ